MNPSPGTFKVGTRKVRTPGSCPSETGATDRAAIPLSLGARHAVSATTCDMGVPMSRLIPPALLKLLVCIAISGSASATTYYIAANGSDTNNGTTNSTAWSHAPGMPGCKNTCSSTTPKAGDHFVFRGGDTWHFGNSSANPYVGGQWKWTWSGSSSSPIYIGVDQTWFAGSSWARPIFSGDNPLSASFVTSCAHDLSTLNLVYLNSLSYVTLDNFEFSGECWAGQISSQATIYMPNNTNVIISNSYFHGWTTVDSAYDNHYSILGGGTGTGVQFVADVFDGSDSSHAAAGSSHCLWTAFQGSPCQSGQGIYMTAYDVHNSIFRYLSNMMVTTNTYTVHDSIFEYLYPSFQGGGSAQHPNVINEVTNVAGSNTYFYNNIVRHTYVTEDIYLAVGNTAYFFNNVFYDNMNVAGLGGVPSGCVRFNAVSSSGSQTAYIANNTIDTGCQINFDKVNSPLQPWNGTAFFQNNHFIGFSNLNSAYVCNTTGACTITDKGNEVFQTESAANAQGYTSGNNYAPTTSTGATVGTGSSLSSSCTIYSSDSELCKGTLNVDEISGSGGEIANFPGNPIVARQSTSWDAGAYQFATTTQVNPPTGLTAVVQ